MYGIAMLKIRRSWDRLISNMGIPTPVRWLFYIETPFHTHTLKNITIILTINVWFRLPINHHWSDHSSVTLLWFPRISTYNQKRVNFCSGMWDTSTLGFVNQVIFIICVLIFVSPTQVPRWRMLYPFCYFYDFHYCQNINYLFNITFIFDRCHCSSVMAPLVKYEGDSEKQT